jgi:hypothetical protein
VQNLAVYQIGGRGQQTAVGVVRPSCVCACGLGRDKAGGGGTGWHTPHDVAKACCYIYSGFADSISKRTREIDSCI